MLPTQIIIYNFYKALTNILENASGRFKSQIKILKHGILFYKCDPMDEDNVNEMTFFLV